MNQYDLNAVERLKAVKAARGLTNQQIADITGVPIGTIGRLFSGEVLDPKLTTIAQIASGLELDMNLICGLATVEPGNIPPTPVARTVESIQFDTLLEQSKERITELSQHYEDRITDLKRDKRILAIYAITITAILVLLFAVDFFIPNAGWIQRATLAFKDTARTFVERFFI